MRPYTPAKRFAISKMRRTRQRSIWRHLKGYVLFASTRRRKLTYALLLLAAHLRPSGWQDMAGSTGVRGGQDDRSSSPRKRIIWTETFEVVRYGRATDSELYQRPSMNRRYCQSIASDPSMQANNTVITPQATLHGYRIDTVVLSCS